MDAVQAALPKIARQQPVVVEARVSESPEMREKLRDQIVGRIEERRCGSRADRCARAQRVQAGL